jgi:hypothetical protein
VVTVRYSVPKNLLRHVLWREFTGLDVKVVAPCWLASDHVTVSWSWVSYEKGKASKAEG